MPTTDTNVPQVIVNKLTKAQYEAATKEPTEFYVVSDEQIGTSDIADGAVTAAKIDFTTLDSTVDMTSDIQLNTTAYPNIAVSRAKLQVKGNVKIVDLILKNPDKFSGAYNADPLCTLPSYCRPTTDAIFTSIMNDNIDYPDWYVHTQSIGWSKLTSAGTLYIRTSSADMKVVQIHIVF